MTRKLHYWKRSKKMAVKSGREPYIRTKIVTLKASDYETLRPVALAFGCKDGAAPIIVWACQWLSKLLRDNHLPHTPQELLDFEQDMATAVNEPETTT